GNAGLRAVDAGAVDVAAEDGLDQFVAVFLNVGAGGVQQRQKRRLGIMPALQLSRAKLQLAGQGGLRTGRLRQTVRGEFLPAKGGEYAKVDQYGKRQGAAECGGAHCRFSFRKHSSGRVQSAPGGALPSTARILAS